MAYTTIDDPTIYFNTVLFTGNGSTQSITGVGFQPDWVWIKNRGATTNHEVADVVRGANKLLKPNDTDAEQSNSNKITSFDSDGFGVGNDANVNQSSTAIVSWNWKAGGSASSNSNGSITSSVSANTTAGFSIVSYTGAGGSSNVGHGLGVAPNFIIAKNKDSSSLNWFVSNDAIGWTKRLKLDGTNNAATNVAFGSSNPDSTKFYLQDNNLNTSGQAHIAYCFAEKKGYSKFGKYTGNGNADGPFLYLGFKPAFFLVKNITNAGYDWELRDNKRDSYNPVGYRLEANTSDAESSYYAEYDFVSNGIKIKQNGNNYNTSGASYIYMAFAESPFVNSNGVPNNAR